MGPVRTLSCHCMFSHWLTIVYPRYCHVVSHPEGFHSVSIGLLYNFFAWKLNQKTNEEGRKLRGTTKKSSLGTYWKLFRLAFERATNDKLDPKLNRNMHKVLGPLRPSKHLKLIISRSSGG